MPGSDHQHRRRAGTAMLAGGLASALGTANAYRPLRRTGALSVLASPPGMVASELPFHAVAAQASAAAVHAALGGLGTWRGRAGLGLHLASWGLLARLHGEAAGAAEVLEQAMVEGLGADYRNRIRGAIGPDHDAPLTRRQLVLPAVGSRRHARARNLAYGEHGRRNLLDIWRLADLPDDAGAPVLVHVHGGAWVFGHKEQQGGPLLAHLARRGWVCASINYRLSPRATWPDHIVDVKRAIAWVRENAHRHGGDPSFLAVTGGSAGGHLCALAALTPGERLFQPGFEEADTRVSAAVPFYGVYDLRNSDGEGRGDLEQFLARWVFKVGPDGDADRWDRASPIRWVRQDAPPFFVVHGGNDSVVPPGPARAFADALRAASRRPVVYAELPRAQHAFDVLGSVRALHTVRAVERFLAAARLDAET